MRWAKAAGAIAGCQLGTSFLLLWGAWAMAGDPGNADGRRVFWDNLRAEALTDAIQFVVDLAILVLAVFISRRLLRDRFALPIGVGLFLVAAAITSWFSFDGAQQGALALIFGWLQTVQGSAIPMVAGAWMLRTRIPGTLPEAISAEMPGAWDTPGGTLRFDPDGVFTLSRGTETTAGLWEVLPGRRPQIVLKVDASTALGHGWQATVMDLELRSDGSALLHADGATAYTRRQPELLVQQMGGYLGTLELLEG